MSKRPPTGRSSGSRSKPRILFDEAWKTFSIYPGNSLYAFCITPEGSLEHLYWGNDLPKGYDLRYLSRSARIVAHDTVEEILQIKKNSRSSLFEDQSSDFQLDPQNKVRYDNLKWRVQSLRNRKSFENGIAMLSIDSSNTTADPPSIVGTVSIIANRDSSGDLKCKDKNCSAEGRSRSLSSPLRFRDGDSSDGTEGSPRSGRMSRSSSKSMFDFASRRVPVDDMGRSSHNLLDSGGNNGRTVRSGSVNLNSGYDMGDPYKLPDETEMQYEIAGAEIHEFEPPTNQMVRIESENVLVGDGNQSGYSTDQSDSGYSKMYIPHKKYKFGRKKGTLGKGTLCTEYSDSGTGDFRSPSFIVQTANGSSITPVKYQSHKIISGKAELPDHLPGIRGTEDDTTTLVITMYDAISGLEIDLYYVCLHDYDGIVRRTVFKNKHPHRNVDGSDDLRPKVIQRAYSCTVDFEASHNPFHMVQLSGSWARERQIVETKLTHGMQTFSSARGVSSHQQNPFAIITNGPPSETDGEVKAFSLVYSGNFIVEAELSEMGRLRFNMGINPMGFTWHMELGKNINTPEVLMVRSSEGMGGISRVLHRITLDKVIPPNWSDIKPPIILNSWEAKYFDVTHNNIVQMALDMLKVNADLLVLDDGWFGYRDDDTSSLGDWVPNPTKFPFGLRKLAEDINQYGAKFGLWIEPEMVSTNSNLYRQHPDWCLHVPGLAKQIGRNQLVLDLSRYEVREYLYRCLHELLASANIVYVKWDMNRPLTEVFSQRGVHSDDGNTEVWQAETSHRFVLGVYELMTKLRKAFPEVLFEHCASGGGRFDLGMLYFSPQIWTSDNTDAIARMRIQYGTSLAYPARCIGAHISEIPNHITGNTTRAKTRALVAMCGTFGYELDLSISTPKETLMYRDFSFVYLQIAPIVRRGDIYRLWNPFKVNFASWMYVSKDKKEAVVFCFSLNSDHWSNLVPRLMLQGLDPAVEYELTEPLPNNIAQQAGNFKIVEMDTSIYQLGYDSVTLSGAHLMNAGLPIKFYTLDDSVMFVLREYTQNEELRC